MDIEPLPTDEEAAAIVAAVTLVLEAEQAARGRRGCGFVESRRHAAPLGGGIAALGAARVAAARTMAPVRSAAPPLASMSGVENAELYTVAPDEVVVTFTTQPGVEVTTRVGGHAVTTVGPYHHARVTGLDAATPYDLSVGDAASTDLCPASVTTLPMPTGELRARFATVNDVHFGELVCGLLGSEEELGPVFSVADGDPPYPEVMNRGAIAELAAGDFDAVLVKGDLTAEGTEPEYEQFLAAYGALGARMRHVRGNHDADKIDTIATTGPFTIELSGVTLAVLDTVIPHQENGRVSREQLHWLADVAGAMSSPMLVFGHHHPWDPASDERSARYFGINPDDSDALCAVIAQHDNIAGYFAGHTHRNRTRHFRVGAIGADRGDRVREGLSGSVGRIPRVRRWLRADRPAHRARPTRCTGRSRRAVCTRASTATTRSAASPTAASPSPSDPPTYAS